MFGLVGGAVERGDVWEEEVAGAGGVELVGRGLLVRDCCYACQGCRDGWKKRRKEGIEILR